MEGLYKSIVHYDIKTMDLKEEHKSTNFKRFFLKNSTLANTPELPFNAHTCKNIHGHVQTARRERIIEMWTEEKESGLIK